MSKLWLPTGRVLVSFPNPLALALYERKTCLGNGLVEQVAFSHLFCPRLIAPYHRNYRRVLQKGLTKSYGIVIFVDLIHLKTAMRESQLGQTIFTLAY